VIGSCLTDEAAAVDKARGGRDFGLYAGLPGEETLTNGESYVVQEDIVIEVLKDFPDNVTAYACHERLTKADYETVLHDIEEKLTRHEKLRMYCEVSPDYVGVDPVATWEDWKVSFSTWFHWQRGVIVTDVQWMIWATKFFGLLVPGAWLVFPMDEASKARDWIVEAQ